MLETLGIGALLHWVATHLAWAKAIVILKKAFLLILPSILLMVALCTVDIDPAKHHAIYAYLHIHSLPTKTTLFMSVIWSMWRWRRKFPLAPFFFVWFGFLASMIPWTPAPWTYMAVVGIFWFTLLFFFVRRQLRWFSRLLTPRVSQ